MLYFHGNAGDLSRWGELVQYFVQKELNVIVMDYRNFGKSTGTLSENNLYEDAELFYAFAKAESQQNNTPLYIYGRSLGTTFASFVASRKECKHLILETPFYSVEDEAKSRFPLLPVKRLLKYRFPTYEYINKVGAPITIIHGTADEVVAYAHGKRLFDSIQLAEKEFITVPNGGHNNLIQFSEFHTAIDSIFSIK